MTDAGPAPRYTLRPAGTEDGPFIYDLIAGTMREYVEATWGWDEAFQQARFRGRFVPAAWQLILIAGEPAGALSLEGRPAAVYLSNIHLLPAHHGCGYGSVILRDLIVAAHAMGLPFTLSVLRANEPALRLYRRLGFRITAELDYRYELCLPPPPGGAGPAAAAD